MILIWLVAAVVFIPIDFFTLGLTEKFYIFLAARLIFAACILLLLFGFQRIKTPANMTFLSAL
jgi:hypothetical protein